MGNLILSIVCFIPAVAAVIMVAFLRGDDEAAQLNAKRFALVATTATFLVWLGILFQFDPSDTGFQFVEEATWLLGLQYKMGVDGISVLFVMLTTFIMPLTVLASWDVKVRVKEYMVAFLLLETLMLGVFMALDLVLFYLFFEAGLIPMFLIIGIWGGANKVYASFKFFLYTFLGSVLMLVAIVAMYADAGTTDIEMLLTHRFATETFSLLGIQVIGGMQTMLFLAFLASFAVKLPMWPVHTWLPDAHVQATTAGSVVLAAILLKLGGYGFLRFSLPMFPVGSDIFAPLILWMSAIAVVALFVCVGVIYDRMHTREIDAYGGLVNRMPAYALVFMLFTMANVGLPGTSGFVGEFLTLMGVFQVNTWVTLVAASGVIFSAAYALWLYRRVVFGGLIKESLKTIDDMTTRERWIFAPLVVMTILLGVYPSLVTDVIGPSTEALLNNYETSLAAAQAATQVAASH